MASSTISIDSKLVNQLDKEGVIVFSNLFTDKLDELREIVKTKDYKKMITTFDNEIKPKIFKKKLGWSTNFRYLFMSNNDNPNPWHRDIWSFTNNIYPQQYTGLLYLDYSKLTYISGSHKYAFFNPLNIFSNKIILNLLNGHIAHHGIDCYDPNNKKKQRRLLHYFNLFPDKKSEKYLDDHTSIFGYRKTSNSLKRVNYMNKYFSNDILYFFLFIFSFLLVSLNLHNWFFNILTKREELGNVYIKNFDKNKKKLFRIYGSYKYYQRSDFLNE